MIERDAAAEYAECMRRLDGSSAGSTRLRFAFSTATAPPPGGTVLVCPAGAPVPDAGYANACLAVIAETLDVVDSLKNRGIRYPKVFYVPRGTPYFDDMFRRFHSAVTGSPWRGDANTFPVGDVVGLSMPETVDRHRRFISIRPDGCRVFPGLRHRLPWVGCGLSYRFLARAALAAGIPRLTVMEDDVILPDGYAAAMETVHAYLDTRGDDWHLFSGIVTHVPKGAKVLRRDTFDGLRFLTLDGFAGMVFSILSRRGLEALASWDPARRDSDNLIDRHLSSVPGLRVITAVPFLFGHDEGGHSTQWDFTNDRYSRKIRRSEEWLLLRSNQQ